MRKRTLDGSHPERRINSREKYLKPIRVPQTTKGKKYFYYVIHTTVEEKWKHGVKVTIQPIQELLGVEDGAMTRRKLKAIRQQARDFNADPHLKKLVEGYLKEMEKEVEAEERKYPWVKRDDE